VPFHPLAEIENYRRVVRCFPAFSQVGFNGKGARRHVRAGFVPDQPAVDEARQVIRVVVDREMGIEVGGIPPPYAQDAAALGLSRLCPPQRRGLGQWLGRQRHASRQASLEQCATTYTAGLVGMLCAHRNPPLRWPHVGHTGSDTECEGLERRRSRPRAGSRAHAATQVAHAHTV
jgi:hypothetical protein